WNKFELLELPLDTWASLKRIGIAMCLSSVAGFLLGVNMGLFPGMRLLMLGFTTFLGIIPTLAILPILFYVFDVDDLGKIMLIFFGTFATISLSMYLSTRRISKEQITKALTLGCSQLQVVYRVVMPQTLPCLIDATRLSLGAAWLFLIAAETTSASEGLGYRIFLVMRYFNMDISIPYVLWITFLGYTGDMILRKIIQWKFSWYLVPRE
ncbi:MAG: ABC transporter permease subunit, partial [Candidatus Sungbacteria bacterium]|nr:ABC transporter permease subunit [Candidatus Sungbacteria bacterium]